MKKYIFILSLTLSAAASLYISNKHQIQDSNILFTDIEALSDCEVRKSDGTLVVECKGKTPICYALSTGSGTFYCFGKQIYPDPEE